MTAQTSAPKTKLAQELGVARSTLYYQSKLSVKDEALRQDIYQVLHIHPSYGYRRLAIHLGVNTKRVLRVMCSYMALSPTADEARSQLGPPHQGWWMPSCLTSYWTTSQTARTTSGRVTLPISPITGSSSIWLPSWTCTPARWLVGISPTTTILR